jgi:hypothetical protein
MKNLTQQDLWFVFGMRENYHNSRKVYYCNYLYRVILNYCWDFLGL